MSAPKRRFYAGRWMRPGLTGGSIEWTAGLRSRPAAAAAVALALAVCACLPYAGFPALGVAALLCGAFYRTEEPLQLLLLEETGPARFLTRKILAAWRNYFLLAAPFAVLTFLAQPRTAWLASLWLPVAALLLLYFVVAKYARYQPALTRRAPLAARLGAVGFFFFPLLPLSLCLTVSYALRAERNLNRYFDDRP